jgi:hypothetical protein
MNTRESKEKETRTRFTPAQKIAIYEQFSAADGKMSQEEIDEWARKEFNLGKPIPQTTVGSIIRNLRKHYQDFAKDIITVINAHDYINKA